MASSSSSGRIEGWTYDVFLSFRGEDTRNNFVDHLHTSIVQKGIRVFKDDEMLRRGKPISSELLKAIEESRFAVVVFSENYANSSWCLDELAKIMECQDRMGQKVLPVFYHVDPSDVRGQKRDFAKAFQQHEEKFREEIDKANKWRKALTAAANLSGWHISPVNGGESLFIDKIVQEISRDIKPRGMESNLIGIESRIEKLNSLLGIEATHEVRMVGICGMGGIGKTTIARALFRRISCKFEGSSFVKGVRENSKRDMCALQQQILKDVLATHHESSIRDPEDGAEMIQRRFCKKKVLLVLDDVDDVKQLEFLAATHEWFGAGSRIIITTRDEHLLSDTNAKYKPAILLEEQAVELFSRHAFRKNSPPDGYEELSNRAIRYTGRLPLALKVLGSFFHGRQACVWESALNRLAKTPNVEIFETLKVSFDGLEVSEQKMFLDIACFFKGKHEDHVTRLLDTFDYDPVIGISVLVEKSLITLLKNKRIDMHDLLHEMGLKIVRENYPNSRLWVPEEIHDCIKKNMKLEAIEAIVAPFDFCGTENGSFSGDVFENMKNLRLLDTHGAYGAFCSCKLTTLPDELQWLRWKYYRLSSLPVANLHKLVGLEIIDCDIQHLWMGYKFLPNLKFIHLDELFSCESFPDVSGAPNVERLILSECKRLVEVHTSLGTLRKLAYLKISSSVKLKYLPPLIEMQSLETLDLFNCFSLEKFPEVSSGMEKLSNIILNGCSSLQIIPNSICELKSLENLHLHDCNQLQRLPEELGSMENLVDLRLGLWDPIISFQRQPYSINFHTLTKLCCLRKLDLSCRQIEDGLFFNNLDACSSLKELHLNGNFKLVQLPASISRLSRLQHLELNHCQRLQNIQGLPSGIQVLKAGNCKALERIEDLTKEYVWLHKIWLPGCLTLLQNQESERYLDKMLQQSVLKKCAVVDHVLSIAIPGSKIPSWFEEQQLGNQIALKLPPKCHTDIIGFAVCGVLQGEWRRAYVQTFGITEIRFRIGINRTFVPKSKVDYVNTSAAAVGESVWIVYIPFSLFQQHMYDDFEEEDWSLFVEGNLVITILEPEFTNKRVARCGAHIVYKEDVDSIQQINTCIPGCVNSNVVRTGGDCFAYIE